MKRLLPLPIICLCSFQFALANPNSAEQAIFGNQSKYNQAQPKQQQEHISIESTELKRLFHSVIDDNNVVAADTIKQAANSGNRNASLYYGYLANTGKLPNKGTDFALAMKAYRKASRQKNKQGQEIGFYGNHLATYNIGLMYLNGHGVPKNPTEAYRWFKICNETYKEKNYGDSFFPALVHMARMLQTGLGVPKDDKQAVEFWRLASEKSSEAKVAYAKMAIAGQGMPVTMTVAVNKLEEAANQWNQEAILTLIKIYGKGDGLTRKANKVAVAKWYLILSAANKKYKGKANSALSELKPEQQNEARKEANIFLSGHSRLPDTFDYNNPLYQNPKKH